MTTLKERLKKFITHLGVSVRQFEANCDLGANTLGNNPRGAIRSDSIEKILNCYAELSATWLLTGKGKMIAGAQVAYDDCRFLKKNDIEERVSIQISGETYASITNVVNFVHGGKISPSDYCNNVIAVHIDTYRNRFNLSLQKKGRKLEI
jgi:transcriptional regulator with XRE-family HTH domain